MTISVPVNIFRRVFGCVPCGGASAPSRTSEQSVCRNGLLCPQVAKARPYTVTGLGNIRMCFVRLSYGESGDECTFIEIFGLYVRKESEMRWSNGIV